MKKIGKDIIKREELYNLYIKQYSNDNKKTFENMVSLLKKYEVLNDYSKKEYYVMLKKLYRIKEQDELKNISKMISKEYKDIKTIIWDTSLLNEFTHHYLMKTFIVVETEKYAIDLIYALLKEKMPKKYTIVTEKMYNDNKDYFFNDEKIIVVKALNSRAPLEKIKEGMLEPTLEKIMIDIYKDKLFEYVQGKELEYIYTNILSMYSINYKKLYSYAKDRMNVELFKKYLEKIKIKNNV